MTYDLLLESHSRGKRKRNRKCRSVADDNDESLIDIDVELLAIGAKLPALRPNIFHQSSLTSGFLRSNS